MNEKIKKFISWLLIISVVFMLIDKFVIQEFLFSTYNDSNEVPTQFAYLLASAFHMLYYLLPAVAVFIVEKDVRKMFANYNITLKGLKNIKRKYLLYLILSSLFLFSIIILLFIFVFGNLFGIEIFGEIGLTHDFNIYEFIPLPSNIYIKALVLSIFFIFSTLVSVFLFGFIYTLCGEIAWRGFLEENLKLDYIRKYIYIGLIWTLWKTIPSIISYISDILLRNNQIDFNYSYITFIIAESIFYIVLSLFLRDIIKITKTIWASTIFVTIITKVQFVFLFTASAENHGNYSIIGANGVLATVSILIIWIISRKINKQKINLKWKI